MSGHGMDWCTACTSALHGLCGGRRSVRPAYSIFRLAAFTMSPQRLRSATDEGGEGIEVVADQPECRAR
jgi:hypothetical protein